MLLVDAVRDSVSGSEDGLGQSGLTDGVGRCSDDGRCGSVSVRSGVRGSVGEVEVRGSVSEDLTLPAGWGGSSSGLSGFVLGGEFSLGCGDFWGVLDGHWEIGGRNNRSCCDRCGLGSQMGGLGGSYFRGVLDWKRSDQIGDRSLGEGVGEDAESSVIGGVGDADLFALRVDVSVAADLVAESVAEVGGGLSGVSITEAGLAELILRVVLGGGVGRIAVDSGQNGRSGSWEGSGSCSGHWNGADGTSGIWEVSRVAIATVVSTISVSESAEPLGLGSHSQHQQASNLLDFLKIELI